MTKLNEFIAGCRQRLERAPDCGDNNCRFAKVKGGMRTNGGCRCVKSLPIDARRFFTLAPTDLETALKIIERQAQALRTIERQGHPDTKNRVEWMKEQARKAQKEIEKFIFDNFR